MSLSPTLQSYPASVAPIEEWETLTEGLVRGRQLGLADGSPAPDSIATVVSSCWTATDLFVRFEGRFQSLRSISDPGPGTAHGMTPELWERSDVFEFFIGRDARRLGSYFEFQVAPDGRFLALAISHEGDRRTGRMLPDSGFTCLSVVDTTRFVWRGLFRIGWALLTDDGPRDGFDCNAYRASGRFHGDELLALAPTGYGDGCFHRYGSYASLELVRP